MTNWIYKRLDPATSCRMTGDLASGFLLKATRGFNPPNILGNKGFQPLVVKLHSAIIKPRAKAPCCLLSGTPLLRHPDESRDQASTSFWVPFCNGMTSILVSSSRKKAIDPATSLQLIQVILDFSSFGNKGFQHLVMKLHSAIIKARGRSPQE